jgi:ankyrin repeat protein
MEIGEKIEITKFNMNELFEMAAKGEWDKVVDIYRKFPEAHKAKSSSSGDTAVHIAVSQQGKEEIVKQLVDQIRSPRGGGIVALEIKNDEGNTPLHVALSKGNVRMCECIAQAYPSLVGVGNVNRQTPIFLARGMVKQDIFLKLLKAVEGDTPGEH